MIDLYGNASPNLIKVLFMLGETELPVTTNTLVFATLPKRRGCVRSWINVYRSVNTLAATSSALPTWPSSPGCENIQNSLVLIRQRGRGRNAGHPAPPAQIRTCATNASGSYLE